MNLKKEKARKNKIQTRKNEKLQIYKYEVHSGYEERFSPLS